jgi:hypothetical protein
MRGVAVVDANLLVLLVVGSASTELIAKHKRLSGDYNIDHFDFLRLLIGQFDDLVLLPHVLAETSNLASYIYHPARIRIQAVLRKLILTATEFPAPSLFGAQREEFGCLGLTDSVILHMCTMSIAELAPTLITADTALANIALSQGYSAINFKEAFQSAR